MVYMHLFNYYCMEILLGGRDHYGVPEDDAIEVMCSIFLHGMLAKAA